MKTRSTPHGAKRGVATLEFALIAPMALSMIWGVFDVSRALIAWEETCRAAEAVAQAAEKMSVTGTSDSTGAPVLSLTTQRMQDAMTTIYAEMPMLGLGNGSGGLHGNFSVTLSGVTYVPPCPATAQGPSSCVHPQIPQVIWSAYLAQGGPLLLAPPAKPIASLLRACGVPINILPNFANDVTQLQTLLDVNKAGSGTSTVTMAPQVVADVQYVFTPTFPLLTRNFTFWASASFPAPLGGNEQPIVLDLTHSTNFLGTVVSCVLSPVYGGSI